jgi:hypothetical protein
MRGPQSPPNIRCKCACLFIFKKRERGFLSRAKKGRFFFVCLCAPVTSLLLFFPQGEKGALIFAPVQ